MKIMDTSDGDGECKIDAVISAKEKKTKQARLPFQTLSSDSPTNKKKRKSLASPEVRSAKLPKVNTKENSFKKPKETEDISEEIIIDEKEENEATETNNIKDNGKQVITNETPDSKNKKTTPGKGLTKTKKSESKVQATSLTKFFKKIDKDNKESKCETQTTTSTNKDKEAVKSSSEKEESQVSKKSDAKNNDTSKNKNSSSITECLDGVTMEAKDDDTNSNKDCKMSENSDSRISISSDDNEQKQTDKSYLNATMDVDSDVNLLSDDSDEENDDSDKSESDSKRTEHEDTDSKDDTNKNGGLHILSVKNKLLDSSTKTKRLTPKQLEKKLEMQKKRDMRERQRFEREKKLQEERESRKKEKEEKRKEREEKRKEREENEKALKDQKKKEKELKDLKKQAELEQKQKEKEAKEEDRRKREEAKEEEKRRKEEERLEAERKKQKIASNFVRFFVAKKPTDSKPVEDEKKVVESRFMPFEIKADMRVAPAIRRNMTKSEKARLDELIKSSDVNKSQLYISELKNKKYNIRKSEKTWPLESNDDVVILEDEDEDTSSVVQSGNTIRQKLRPKLFMFEENRRPPYWGTWRKKSETIHPRRPLGKDTKHFDYEVDSDEEWEEEEPGESLHGSDDEREKEEEPNEENEYDVDNDFMVPHGYLSEEEILGADEEDEDEEDLNPEQQKTKLKILGEQFEAERNTKTKKLKPKVIGCVWLNKENVYPETLSASTIQFLTARQAWTREIPLSLTPPADADNPNHPEYGTTANKASIASSVRKAKAIEDVTPDLIHLLHGNTNSQKFLLKEFLEFISRKNEGVEKLIPKSKLHQKIRDVATWMACPEPGPMQDKYCWYVTEACRTQYLGEEKLPLPNEWTYCLTPKKKSVNIEVTDKSTDKEKEKEKEKEKKTVPLITQFTKTLTAEEKQKQLTEKAASTTPVSKSIEKPLLSTSTTKATPPTNRPPKRATLISVPRGEPLPKSPRMSLMDKFVTKDSPLADSNNEKNKKSNKDDLDDDDCAIINVTDDQDEVATSSKADSPKDVDKSPKKESKSDEDVSVKSDDDKPQNVSTTSDVDVLAV